MFKVAYKFSVPDNGKFIGLVGIFGISKRINKGFLGNEELDISLSLRPDIVVDHKEKGVVILDSKYKSIGRFDNWVKTKKLNEEIMSGDVYQVLIYAMKNARSNVYLLYPQYRLEDPELEHLKIQINMRDENGTEYKINVIFVRIPFVFEDEEATRENLKSVLLSLFDSI